jgi:DNA gyrase/topoisomerase IV subunit A
VFEQDRIKKVMCTEAQEIADRFGRDRRTVISHEDIAEVAAPEELVPDERCLIILSSEGHTKRVKDTAFLTQVCLLMPYRV